MPPPPAPPPPPNATGPPRGPPPAPATRTVSPLQAFGSAIAVQPWGVLGSALGGAQAAAAPDGSTLLVDPAGLAFIKLMGPSGAGGAAGAIYRFLGIAADASFPPDVVHGINAEAEATHHVYSTQHGLLHVIHVVGPDFRSRTERCTREEAVALLARAYAAVLALAATAAAECTILRLLPISSGIFAGRFKPQMAALTADALLGGYALLANEQPNLLPALPPFAANRALELCLFNPSEATAYARALRQRVAPKPASPPPPPARLRPRPAASAGEMTDGTDAPPGGMWKRRAKSTLCVLRSLAPLRARSAVVADCGWRGSAHQACSSSSSASATAGEGRDRGPEAGFTAAATRAPASAPSCVSSAVVADCGWRGSAHQACSSSSSASAPAGEGRDGQNATPSASRMRWMNELEQDRPVRSRESSECTAVVCALSHESCVWLRERRLGRDV